MSKSIKLQDDTFLDSTGIVHNKVLLSEILKGFTSDINNVDLDTLTTDFVAGYGFGLVNAPVGDLGHVISIPRHGDNGYVTQLFSPYGSRDLYVRRCDGSTWDEWTRLARADEIKTTNIISTTITSDISITGSATVNDVKLPSLIDRVGTGLTLVDGRVHVGTGVNRVRVSGSVRITNNNTSTASAYNCYVYKNNTVVASGRMAGVNSGASCGCTTPVVTIPVEEGDVIKLSIWKAETHKCTIVASGNCSVLTVESI